jgi:mRNA interferase MazF
MASPKRTGTRPPIGARRAATRSGSPQSYCPEAGDFIWLDLEPSKGHEQAGRRPALVLSPRVYNARAGLCIACPVTNQAKGYPFETPIPAGQPVSGVVLADQPRAMAWPDRRAQFIAKTLAEVVDDVRAKLAVLIGV